MKEAPYPQTPVFIFRLMKNNRKQGQIQTNSKQPSPWSKMPGLVILTENNLRSCGNQKDNPDYLINPMYNGYFMR